MEIYCALIGNFAARPLFAERERFAYDDSGFMILNWALRFCAPR